MAGPVGSGRQATPHRFRFLAAGQRTPPPKNNIRLNGLISRPISLIFPASLLMVKVAKKKQIDPTFGRRLRALREERGWTQTVLGERAGMGYQEVARIERGEREPTWGTVRKLASALEVTPDSFLAESD